MAIFRNHSTIRRLRESLPGELVHIANANGGTSLAVALAQELRQTLVGVLEPIPGFMDHPGLYNANSGSLCIAYGRDWLIVPQRGPESWIGNDVEHSGALVQTNGGLIVCFHPRRGDARMEAVYFDLIANDFAERNRESVPFHKWSIWAREEHRNRDEPPLHTVSVANQA